MTTLTLNLSYRNPVTDALESNPLVVIPGTGTLIGFADFADNSAVPASILTGTGWQSQFVSAPTGYLKFLYDAAEGGGTTEFDFAPLAQTHVYVQFDARQPSASKGGCKFLKFFSGKTGSNYSSFTLTMDYSSNPFGALTAIYFGDGTDEGNDGQNAASLTAGASFLGSRNAGAVISNPQGSAGWPQSNWGTSWHNFKIHVKYNSGTSALNEVADGEFYVEIDGLIYLHVTNIFNRHYSNQPFDRIEFGGYKPVLPFAFELDYDNIKISRDGFV